MRKALVCAMAVALVASGFPVQPSFAQTSLAALNTQPVDKTAQISSAIQAFPNGGPALRSHIADLIARDPDMAQALAKYLLGPNNLNEAQKQAAEAGLADALNRLGIVAQDVPPGLNPWVVGTLAVGGLVGLGLLIANANKSKAATPQPNTSNN